MSLAPLDKAAATAVCTQTDWKKLGGRSAGIWLLVSVQRDRPEQVLERAAALNSSRDTVESERPGAAISAGAAS